MKTLTILTRLTLLLLLIGFTSCSNDDNGPMPPENEVTIVGAAQATAELSTLVAALQKADESANNDLVATLSGEGSFTVFAPTNQAFNDLLAQLDGFDSLDDFNTEQLQDLLAVILTYHVVGQEALSTDLSNGMSLTTVQGSTLQVSTEGGVFIQDATDVAAEVTTADIETSNGVVHIIDKVLLPQAILDELADIILVPITDLAIANENLQSLVAALQAANGDLPTVLRGAGPYTVLAPTDTAFETFLDGAALEDVPVDVLTNVLLNHVISGEVTSEDLVGLGAGYTSTLALGAGERNMSLYFDATGDVTFNGTSTVVTPDVKALNGIVHVVDAVIDVPNIVDHAVANPGLSSLVGALTDGGNTTFTDLLSNEAETFTVFAPGNDAFSAFTNPNSNDINAVLANHVVMGAALYRSDLTTTYVNTEAEFAADENISLYVNADDDGVTLNGTSSVVMPDIVATNGVIHTVDAVIDLPTVVTFAAADPNFSTLVQALTELTPSTDFVSVLSAQDGAGSDPFTVFAPTNDAFAALSSIPAEADLIPILQHHVVAGANVRSGDLSDGATATTLEGDMITINLPGTGENIADITDGAGNTGIGIDFVDVQAINGVIHVVDTVLIPDTTN
ncbi:fasciclin domain-containing protein [Flagellimonas crocea]|uniref:fasciclin domain-containing protein n=1 Tax=Flagellimonas crocea TaxID=3067311 RepID=UPI00296EB941|nr:fasciclin domain-containing protein [Muricauda sp. DH64]